MSAPASSASKPAAGGVSGGLATRLIHVGQEPDPITGAVAVPISLASTFAQSSPGVPAGRDSELSYGKGFEYCRTGNPTRAAYEKCLASAESGKHAVAFASGMAATASVIHLLLSGDHVVCIDDVYGGTQRYFRRVVQPTYGITFSFVDLTVDGELEKAVTEKTKMVWIETPTNPTLKIVDIAKIAAYTRAHGLLLVVDNTFMTPVFQRPLELGADISLNSITKYINGHSDVVGGIVAVNTDELNEKLRFIQNGVGAVPSPFDCYMTNRGMKTLHLRMERHARNALAVATMLEAHPFVEKVLYPGLPSHPQHEIAVKQTSGHGGMITFYIKGSLANARVFLENLKVFTLAESLGAVESLAESPAIMTHASVPEEHRRALGISDTLIRLSVGLEDEKDIIDDVANALEIASKV
jgi:cystathionine gamma-lyase